MEYVNQPNRKRQTGETGSTKQTGRGEQIWASGVPGPDGLWIRDNPALIAPISNETTEAPSFFSSSPLLVASAPAHSNIQVSGLGWFVRAYECRVHNLAGVVAANDCTLKSEDHYHVRKASLSMDRLLALPGNGQVALRRLFEEPTDRSKAEAFQRELRLLSKPPEEAHETQVSVPLARRYRMTIDECDVLQVGDHSKMRVVNRYIVDETVLSAVDLLARSIELIQLFATALSEPQSGGAMRKFLRAAMREARCEDDLDLIRNACGLDEVSDPWLDVFFGIAAAADMTAVMAGADNTLVQMVKVRAPGIVDKGSVLDDFDGLRSDLRQPEPGSISNPVADTLYRNLVTPTARDQAAEMRRQLAIFDGQPSPPSDLNAPRGPHFGPHL